MVILVRVRLIFVLVFWVGRIWVRCFIRVWCGLLVVCCGRLLLCWSNWLWWVVSILVVIILCFSGDLKKFSGLVLFGRFLCRLLRVCWLILVGVKW